MAHPGDLHTAADRGDLAALQACLAAGADPNQQRLHEHLGICQVAPLHLAVRSGRADCVGVLIAAGADPDARDGFGTRPLHYAAVNGDVECAETLLSCGASPLAVETAAWTPAHSAATHGRTAVLRLLLAAWPEAAAAETSGGNLPLHLALAHGHLEASRCLLQAGPLPPLYGLLHVLGQLGEWAQPLFASAIARRALRPKDWEQVPSPCMGLGTALPAVLERSADEARQLVHHLPAEEQAQLRTFALCLGRAQRCGRLPSLPSPLAWRMLALSVAD